MSIKSTLEENENCDICYELSQLIGLKCCNNTKKICNNCLECLTKPICPWCRQDLPQELIKKQMIATSCVNNYGEYFRDETNYLLINPYDTEYNDSRILRRTMRNIRRRFNRMTQRNTQQHQQSASYPPRISTSSNRHRQRQQHGLNYIITTGSHSIPQSSAINTHMRHSISNGSLSNDSNSSIDGSDNSSHSDNELNDITFDDITLNDQHRQNKKSKRTKRKENKCRRHTLRCLTKEITQQVNNGNININKSILNADSMFSDDDMFQIDDI